ncbi:putative lipid phosphate phosphatase 3, chloroplastic isoform X2 [Hibiscus syriacus]|uniref:putative lipid phosphate phosphatase 3, chloroplastic isoform X2 n=1 Tax=Hibiscus syriacus TaxID=106335 RepID=UPI0019207D54|nr:putative lipid phosphate phosphatase 3, chloroplastic isoform X2 [Hibiscus syriacus]
MQEVHLGSHTIRSHGAAVARTHMHDWLILLLLVVIEMYAILLPMLIFVIVYIRRRDVYDLHHAVLGLLFSVLVTAVITESIKNAVGRPRPDFFWRCFPDGKMHMINGEMSSVMAIKMSLRKGIKAFQVDTPLGPFAGLGFLSLYLSGKIKVFDRRGHVAKLCVVFLPLLVASLVGISRVDDYWHHWQDVFAGGLLGLVVSTFCYLQFFPPPYDANGWGTFAYFRVLEESIANTTNTANAGNLAGESQILNQQGQSDNGFMGMHLAREANSTMGDMESGKS